MDRHLHVGVLAFLTWIAFYFLFVPVKVALEWGARKLPILSGAAALANA